MKLKTLTPLFIGIALLVIAGVAYGITYSFVGTKSAEVASLTQQIAQKDAASTDIAAAKQELAGLQSQEATVDQYFVSTSDVVPFLEQLASTGKFLGTNVQVVSVAATPGDPYGQLNLSLTIAGPFNAVLRTLGAVEYGPEDTRVSNVTLQGPGLNDVASSSPTWTASAVFVIGAKNAAAVVAPATPNPAPSTPTLNGASASTSTPVQGNPIAPKPTGTASSTKTA